MGYRRTRNLLIGAAFVIQAVLVAVLLARSVDDVEVLATVAYLPLFVVAVYFGVVGGTMGAAVATAGYVALRLDSIDALGSGEFAGLVASRAVAYLLFGAIGGWAAATLEQALDKLDLHDHIDDRTGLYNARFLLGEIEIERARADRYRTMFSVVFVDFPAAPLRRMPRRRRTALLGRLGPEVGGGLRTVDRTAHGSDGVEHHLAVVLPETPTAGAIVVRDRLEARVRDLMVASGVDEPAPVSGLALTLPGDEGPLSARIETWERIDAVEHAAPRG